MPVLAHVFERAGLSTVVVTGMPWWCERLGTPRTLGVEFPFGHYIGRPHDREMQMAVVRAALALLAEAKGPEETRELDIPWPQPDDEAKRDWQPLEPSPIIKMMLEQRAKAAQQRREGD